MTVLQFIASIIDSVAWPSAILLLTYLFRREVGPLIGSLRKFTWGDKTLEFDRRLDAAEADASNLPAPPEEQLQLPAPNQKPPFIEAGELSPQLAIVEAWLPLERRLYALGASHGYGSGRARSATFLLRRLASDGVIDRRTEKLINDLREMRNFALHSPSGAVIPIEDIRRYRELADTVLEALKSAS